MAGRIVTDIYRELHIIILAQSTRAPQFVAQRRAIIEQFLDRAAEDVPMSLLHRLHGFCQTGARAPTGGELAFSLVLQLAWQGLRLDWAALEDDSHLTPVLHDAEPAWPIFFCVNVGIPVMRAGAADATPVPAECRLDVAVGKKTPEGEPLVGAVQLYSETAPPPEPLLAHARVSCWRLRESAFYANPAAAAEALLRWAVRL